MLQKMNRKIRRLLASGRLPGFGREGFTLVEIMMVLMILTVGVLPIAIIQHRARGEVSEADRATQAIEVAQLHLERTKGLGFGNAVDSNGQDGHITWAVTVTNVAFGLDRVQVTATWRNDGATETLTIADLMSTR
ncbi:MAG: prepilin-type N-terminal cleavage/methylation domain-containing protein [Acidobacteriota bacterium]